MASTYVTTYRQDYRGDRGGRTKLYQPPDPYENDYCCRLFKSRYGPHDLEICSANSYSKLICENKRKIQSEYQVQFLPGKLPVMREKARIPCSTAHELAAKNVIKIGDNLYCPKKINRPMYTGRIIWGYKNPDHYRTGLSEYAGVIGYNGYCMAKYDYRNCIKPYKYRLNDIPTFMH